MEISLEDGKYTYRFRDGVQTVHRYGEPWRDLTGDKFVYLLAATIEQLKAENARLKEELAAAQDDVVAWKYEADGFRRNRDALSAELIAAQADAESLRAKQLEFYVSAVADAKRYRWLREACETKEDWGWLICDADADVVLKLDAAIDGAIAKGIVQLVGGA